MSWADENNKTEPNVCALCGHDIFGEELYCDHCDITICTMCSRLHLHVPEEQDEGAGEEEARRQSRPDDVT